MERDRRVEVRLTLSEYEILKRRVENGNFKNMSDLLRRRAFDPECSERNIRKELRDLTFQIRKIGININQIAHRWNAGFQRSFDEVVLLYKMQEIDKRLSEIRELFIKDK